MDPFKPYVRKPPASVPPRLTLDGARTVALQALAFIAADDDALGRFSALTGCGLDDLRARTGDDGFLGGVLDHLLGDEASLLAFVAATGLAPGVPMAARALLG